jgi:hypothetical protein
MLIVHRDQEAKSMPKLKDIKEISQRPLFFDPKIRYNICSNLTSRLICYDSFTESVSLSG